MVLESKIKIWILIVRLHSESESKLTELFELFSLHEEHWVAKYSALKFLGLLVHREMEKMVLNILEKWKCITLKITPEECFQVPTDS